MKKRTNTQKAIAITVFCIFILGLFILVVHQMGLDITSKTVQFGIFTLYFPVIAPLIAFLMQHDSGEKEHKEIYEMEKRQLAEQKKLNESISLLRRDINSFNRRKRK